MYHNVLIIVGPSGVGKTSVVNYLCKEFPSRYTKVLTTTSRKPREGEEHGVHYNFVSEEEFKKKIAKDDFIEFQRNYGNYYGTEHSQLELVISAGTTIGLLILDPVGALALQKEFNTMVSLAILPEDIEDSIYTMGQRNTGQEDIEKRIKGLKEELALCIEDDIFILVPRKGDVAFTASRVDTAYAGFWNGISSIDLFPENSGY